MYKLFFKNAVLYYPRKIRRKFRLYKNRTKYVYHREDAPDVKQRSILVVSHSAIRGGAPVLLLHIVKELQMRGYQIFVVAKDYGPMLPEFAKYAFVEVCTNQREFRKYVQKLQPYKLRNCICNSVASADYVTIAKEYGMHVELLIHEMRTSIEQLGIMRKAKRAAWEPDRIVFPSKYVLNSFETIAPVKTDHLIAPQGLYIQEVEENPDKCAARRHIGEKYGVSVSGTMILNVATSNYRKGFDLFIEAARQASEWQFVWVGFDEERFAKSVLQNPLPANVKLIGYVTERQDLLAFYDSADVFALTSREEPFGSVVQESFSRGVPVAAYADRGGYADIVINDQTGYLAPKLDAEHLLEAIAKIMTSPEHYRRMADNCREKVRKMSFSNYVDKILSLF